MRYIFSLLLYLLSGLTFLIFGPFLLIVIFIYPKSLYLIVIPFCQLMITTFGCTIKSNKKVPLNETYVIMANHVSFLDVFAIPTVFTGKFTAVAASKNFNIPVYATILKKLKVVSIDRSNRDQSIKGIKQAESLIQKGYHVVVLPEGTRTKDGKLGSFKKGGFHLAVNTKTKILPIVTKGLFKIKPLNRWTIMPGRIIINIVSIASFIFIIMFVGYPSFIYCIKVTQAIFSNLLI